MMLQALHTVLFYAFAALAVGLAIATVTTRHILRSAIYLMGVLTASSGFYVMLKAPFLAGVQVLVYVGGIAVLFVFAVMLTSPLELMDDAPKPLRRFLGLTSAAMFFGLTVQLLRMTHFNVPPDRPAPDNDAMALGRAFMDSGKAGYTLPFELVSLLLLAAVIGGIVLARKTTQDRGAAGKGAAK
jgi:NADH-quinone oxidoreductase subunit J